MNVEVFRKIAMVVVGIARNMKFLYDLLRISAKPNGDFG